MQKVYILGSARTPIGSFLGSLSQVPASKLGSVAIAGALKSSEVEVSKVSEVFMGHVIQAGCGQAPARQAAIGAELGNKVPCTTINKVCGSGLQATVEGMRTIQVAENELVISGGMENMSLAPHLMPSSRSGIKFGEAPLRDSMQWDGLWDVYSDRPMGNCAEECAKKYNFSREMQDSFSIESYKRSQSASEQGIFAKEISPVTIKGRKGDIIVDRDEEPFKAKFDKIPLLKPAFDKNGTITAANASTINDGAAALVMGGEQYKKQAKFEILGLGKNAHDPTWFTTAPVEAMRRCAKSAQLELSDFDLFEINEAFAVVPMAAIKELNLSSEKVNVFGGAVSLGHPIGCSGARILVTLMNALTVKDKELGMASICIGGGEALAVAIRRLK